MRIVVICLILTNFSLAWSIRELVKLKLEFKQFQADTEELRERADFWCPPLITQCYLCHRDRPKYKVTREVN